MENKVLSFKDLVYLGGLLLSLAGAYFSLRSEINDAQVRNQSALDRLELNRVNDNKILELKISALQLQVAKLESELQKKR